MGEGLAARGRWVPLSRGPASQSQLLRLGLEGEASPGSPELSPFLLLLKRHPRVAETVAPCFPSVRLSFTLSFLVRHSPLPPLAWSLVPESENITFKKTLLLALCHVKILS